jgi:hypothetical protein
MDRPRDHTALRGAAHRRRRTSPAVQMLEPRRLFDGLTGQYFNRVDGTELVTTRTDATLDFTWAGSPAAGVKADHFSARWTGQVLAPTSDVYTFTTSADDGVRLWIDGRLIVDNWVNQSTTDRSGTVALEAGKWYDIRLDYYDFDQGARLRLQWASSTIAKQTVPTTALFAAPAGLIGTFYDGIDFTNPRTTRVDANIDFTWPAGQPDPVVAADGFAARWTGYIVPQFGETYTFSVASTAPTTLRLRVDGKLIVDNTSVQDDGRVRLEAGVRYPIVLEYADSAGAANVRLDWQSPSLGQQPVPANRLVAAAATSIPSTRATYTNPTLNIDAPDPGVIHADGAYWMIHTTGGPNNGWPLWKSSDMVNWSYVKDLLTPANKRSWMNGNYWAPEIHKVGNQFILTGTSVDSRTGQLVIVLASSTEIDGPYTIRSEPIVSNPVATLDSNIFIDDDGKVYLLWKRDSNGGTGTFGSIRIRQLDSTGLNFAAGSSETVMLDNQFGGWEKNLAEAPWLVRRADAYYLFYSGAFIDTTYSVGVARSTFLATTFTRNPSNPILTNNSTWGGPGHGGFVMDNDGALWHLYHARLLSNPDAGRKQMLDPLVWTSTWPTFANNSPSTGSHVGPRVNAASGAGVLSLTGNATLIDTYRVVRSDTDASLLNILLNGALVSSKPFAEVQQLTLNAVGGDDVLILDATRGDVIPGGGITFAGGTGADEIRIVDPNGFMPFRHLGAGRIAYGSGLATSTGVEKFTLVGGDHHINADLAGAALDIQGATRVTFNASQKLGAMFIAADSTGSLAAGDRSVVVTSVTLADGGKLDVNDGTFIVDYAAGSTSPIDDLVAGLRTGRAGGTWAGTSGIVSAAAAASPAARVLGVSESTTLGAPIPGVVLDTSAVVIRYTLPGDANLDRTVGFADLVLLSQNYGQAGHSWGSGDFDYSLDGMVDFADLVILAQNYNATLPAIAAVTAYPGTSLTKRRTDDRNLAKLL